MSDSPTFRSLVDVAQRIVDHPPLPRDRKAIRRCMQCIDDFYYQTRITADEWEYLREILMDACP